jgi:hypothetical protein
MHKARAFFFVCAGLLCLALVYHLGAQNAGAQLGSSIAGVLDYAGGRAGGIVVVTQSGDCYVEEFTTSLQYGGVLAGAPRPLGNFWSGATPAERISIGQLKARYATPSAGK